jgi:hypothetical protein
MPPIANVLNNSSPSIAFAAAASAKINWNSLNGSFLYYIAEILILY